MLDTAMIDTTLRATIDSATQFLAQNAGPATQAMGRNALILLEFTPFAQTCLQIARKNLPLNSAHDTLAWHALEAHLEDANHDLTLALKAIAPHASAAPENAIFPAKDAEPKLQIFLLPAPAQSCAQTYYPASEKIATLVDVEEGIAQFLAWVNSPPPKGGGFSLRA